MIMNMHEGSGNGGSERQVAQGKGVSFWHGAWMMAKTNRILKWQQLRLTEGTKNVSV